MTSLLKVKLSHRDNEMCGKGVEWRLRTESVETTNLSAQMVLQNRRGLQLVCHHHIFTIINTSLVPLGAWTRWQLFCWAKIKKIQFKLKRRAENPVTFVQILPVLDYHTSAGFSGPPPEGLTFTSATWQFTPPCHFSHQQVHWVRYMGNISHFHAANRVEGSS